MKIHLFRLSRLENYLFHGITGVNLAGIQRDAGKLGSIRLGGEGAWVERIKFFTRNGVLWCILSGIFVRILAREKC